MVIQITVMMKTVKDVKLVKNITLDVRMKTNVVTVIMNGKQSLNGLFFSLVKARKRSSNKERL